MRIPPSPRRSRKQPSPSPGARYILSGMPQAFAGMRVRNEDRRLSKSGSRLRVGAVEIARIAEGIGIDARYGTRHEVGHELARTWSKPETMAGKARRQEQAGQL